jgi:hypothetical protein
MALGSTIERLAIDSEQLGRLDIVARSEARDLVDVVVQPSSSPTRRVPGR